MPQSGRGLPALVDTAVPEDLMPDLIRTWHLLDDKILKRRQADRQHLHGFRSWFGDRSILHHFDERAGHVSFRLPGAGIEVQSGRRPQRGPKKAWRES